MARRPARTIPPMPSKSIPRKVAAAHEFVSRHFRDDPALADVAEAAGLSRFHLLRQFSRWYGRTPKQLATELRIAEAKRLIQSGVPMGDVYARLGFLSQRHFSGRFRRVVGLTPTAWLRKQRKGFAAASRGLRHAGRSQ